MSLFTLEPGEYMPDQDTTTSDERQPQATLYSVGLYLCDRAFGGREEGGWWYDTGQLVTDPAIYGAIGCLPTVHLTEEDANEARALMASRLTGINQGRREISSVASDGMYYAEIHEGMLPAYYPAQLPRYE